MPYKNYEDQKDYHKQWYKRNKQRLIQKAARNNNTYRQRNLEYILEVKDSPCSDCGIKYPPYVMDFDHTGDDKQFNVSRLWRLGCSLATLKKEIAKCELVCSNCHRVRTFTRSVGETANAVGLNPTVL